MSLAKQIAARMLAKKSTAAAVEPRVVSAPPRHTSPQAYNPPPVPMAERRRRIAEGQKRRNEPPPPPPPAATPPAPIVAIAQPVPTSAPPRVTPPPLPFIAPRPELEVDLVKVLEALPLPVPVAPAEPPRLAPNLTTGFRGSCKAINADTGKQCALLAGHTTSHRHGATAFVRVAAPDQKSFHRRDLLDRAANTNPNEAS